MLRDVLTKLPGFVTWPCDEINFVWKHGNLNYLYDDLPVTSAKLQTKTFVRRQFSRISKPSGAPYVVEKTCANSLRVDYVDAIVPEAKYILLVRDGYDAITSIIRRWQSPVPGGSYYLQKARFVAPTDLLTVFWQSMNKRMRGKKTEKGGSWDTWGPVFPELDELLRDDRPLPEICALQWVECVQSALRALENKDPSSWLPVSYEDFVDNPNREVEKIMNHVSASVDNAHVELACKAVHRNSIDSDNRNADVLESVRELVDPAIEKINSVLGAKR
jgi:hypothetical protein